MKFLIIVLAIHVIGEIIGTKRKTNKEDKADGNIKIVHPAEFPMRIEL
jgi:hypothetical protein